MKKRYKNKYQEIIGSFNIEKAGGEGKAIGYHDGKVVFVKVAAPGDIADIKITAVKRRFLEAEIVNLIQPSPLRQTPFCEHFGTCGGCKWQHLKYEEQLKLKNQWAIDCLQRIGKVEIKQILEPMGALETVAYRNKIEFTFSDKCWEDSFDKENPQGLNGLGFHVPGRWDKILDVNYCHLVDPVINNLRNKVKEIALEHQFEFWNPREQTGWLRNLLIRTSSKGDCMVMLAVNGDNQEAIRTLYDALIPAFPSVNSWMYAINDKRNDSWTGLVPVLYQGKGYMEEQMEELVFKIRPLSFFQTNFIQALRLYQLVREWAEIKPHEVVYDLYTGTGTIAQFVAKNALKVIGLEYIQSAVDDAIENAKVNDIHNTVFLAGDMKDLLTKELFEIHGKPNVILTDPPRDGMHPDVIQAILFAAPERIVYVSCNPATQARDLALLSHLYEVKLSLAVDMFPHTHHVENVVLLIRK